MSSPSNPPFNLFDHPIVFTQAELLSAASAWMDHIPFAFLLVDMALPRVVVELGAHSGISYCAFCQVVKMLGLPTRCFAVDSWEGDTHAGHYSSTILPALREHHDPRYSSFSTLIQSTFDEAVGQFQDGTIDILHIDGLHTYEAVKHDYENWRPKLSKSGILLLHDTAEVTRDFGVHRLWAELQELFPLNFEFRHGHGLGVACVGASPPASVRRFLQYAKAHHKLVRQAFASIGAMQTLRCLLSTVYQQQQVVNEWKRKTGRTVDTRSEEFRATLSNPGAYVAYAAEQIRQLLKQDLETRESLEESS